MESTKDLQAALVDLLAFAAAIEDPDLRTKAQIQAYRVTRAALRALHLHQLAYEHDIALRLLAEPLIRSESPSERPDAESAEPPA